MSLSLQSFSYAKKKYVAMLKKRETYEALKIAKEKKKKNGRHEGSKVLKKIAHTFEAFIKREKAVIKGVQKIFRIRTHHLNSAHLHFLIKVYALHLLGSSF